jgi:hypothetical protein
MIRRAGKHGVRNTGGLSDGELRVLVAFPTGSRVELGAGNADDDPARGESWGPDRQVRARFLLSLLCGAVEVEPDLVGEINLDGARVIGKLGFPGVAFKRLFELGRGRCMTRLLCVVDAGWAMSSRVGGLAGVS